MTLRELAIGRSARVLSVGGEGALRQHFLDMGLIPQAEVTLIKFAPMGDPMELHLHGYELTLRLEDAGKIEIELLEPSVVAEKSVIAEEVEGIYQRALEHPGLGEDGRYHVCSGVQAPIITQLSFALVGNQNCGKTTLFNQLTGSNQHVGNFPGVTVDRKSGLILDEPNAQITDLPGIYSMSPYSSEELVTRRFILDEKPQGIINIVDATNIERNLYLTLQLMELDVPIVLALNMMDELRGNGGAVDINAMEAMLGIPVVPISAVKKEGIQELVNHAVHIAQYGEKPGRCDFCANEGSEGAVHRCLHAIMHLIEDHAQRAGLPVRFAATKSVEGDTDVLQMLALSQNELEMLEHIIVQMEEERGLDRAAAIAAMRFNFIRSLVRRAVIKPRASKERERSLRIDRILTGRYTALPSFVLVMGLVFWLTFGVLGARLQQALEILIQWTSGNVCAYLQNAQVNHLLIALVGDGIFGGVGSVLSFLPLIITLFFFLSLLEDTGYMARVAFVTDKLLRKIGLSGRSVVPMLVGFGCTVPGVMASRILPSARDRKLTILLTPFMSCTAKLPIYALFTAVFFPRHGALVMAGIYLLGIAMAVVMALLLKNTLFRGEAVPFVMELPNYRLPGWRNVGRLLWEKASDFLEKAFTVIFVATIAIWFLQTFDMHLNPVENSQDSMLALIAGGFVPLLKPIGLGDWRLATALISGFIAKESVVSTLGVLTNGVDVAVGITSMLTPVAAGAMLIFCLLYTPCVASVAAIYRELGWKWTVGVVVGQCAVAWIVAFVYMLLFS